jgi:hypothetical protein
MLESLLRGYLVYLSFVQPVIYGAQLCRSTNSDPLQVTNVTLTLIFSWLLEVADAVFLSSFIAMRWLYVCARIVLALYFAHPRFLGAVRIYRKLFATLVDNYSPVIDSMVIRHVETIGESGLMQYGAYVSAELMRGVAAVGGIAKTLLEASSTTTVPAAPLPRRMSQAREDRALRNSPEVQLEAVPPLRSSPSPSLPAARARPVQPPPPSLFDDNETSPVTSSIVEYTFEEVHATDRNAWDEMDESREPVLEFGVPNRPYREPETVVNRGRFKVSNTNLLDE